MPLNSVFEKETCGRCGGSGRYSFNLTTGSTCFGCAGTGERLTKRGYAARLFYVESCTIKLGEVVVGDYVAMSGLTLGGSAYSKKCRVDEVGPYGSNGQVQVGGLMHGRRTGIVGSPDTPIRKYWPKEENDAKVDAALAYQATLNKSGKPYKRS